MEKDKIIIGRNPVLEYIKNIKKNDNTILYISEKSHGKIISEIATLAKKKSISIQYKDKSFFETISSSSKHQGVALSAPTLLQSNNIKDILKKTVAEKGVIVLLDQITDPHNTGSIIRSAEALGCSAVILPKDKSAGITSTVIKSSAGATAHIPIFPIGNIATFIEDAKKHNFWIIGTSDHGTTDILEIKKLKPLILIIGSEGAGMRKLTEEKCDKTVYIPLKGKISSLNASVAAGIIIHQIMN